MGWSWLSSIVIAAGDDDTLDDSSGGAQRSASRDAVGGTPRVEMPEDKDAGPTEKMNGSSSLSTPIWPAPVTIVVVPSVSPSRHAG